MANLRKKLPSANALFVFEAAARCGNFTRAAEELYVTQPAVSRMLSRMEDHLDVQLFERGRAGITLTESGTILYRKIVDGFAGIEAAIDEIASKATGMETVTLSVSTAFTTHWLMPRMTRLHAAFPHVDIRFQLMSGRVAGPLGDVDLGMRFKGRHELDACASTIMPEMVLPVCAPRYHADERDTVIIMDDGERGWHERFTAFREKRRKAGNMLSFSDYAVVLQAALLGQGIALGWVNVVAAWLADGTLVPAEQELLVLQRDCCLVWPPHRPLRPVVKALRDWIIAEIRADLARMDAAHPALQLRRALEVVSDAFGSL